MSSNTCISAGTSTFSRRWIEVLDREQRAARALNDDRYVVTILGVACIREDGSIQPEPCTTRPMLMDKATADAFIPAGSIGKLALVMRYTDYLSDMIVTLRNVAMHQKACKCEHEAGPQVEMRVEVMPEGSEAIN